MKLLGFTLAALLFFGCGEDDPQPTNVVPNNVNVNNVNVNNSNANNVNANNVNVNNVNVNNSTPFVCDFGEGFYRPAEENDWPACVSDGGEYVPFEMSITTAARIAAFETMGDLLWRKASAPTAEDFAAAYEEYSLAEGLLSRVSRREDEHYPPVSDGQGGTLSCRDQGVPEMDPVRCVGPAVMVPMINDAFEAGLAGEDPVVQARIIEATLLWFLYLSVYKEAITCSVQLRDCDSAFAYYTGGNGRNEGIGLAAYIRESRPALDSEIFDALLGVRCWRDADSDIPPANTTLAERSYENLDFALSSAVAALVYDRIADWEQATGVQKDAQWEALRILGQILVRETTERWAADGAIFEAEFAEESSQNFDATTIRGILTGRYECVVSANQ